MLGVIFLAYAINRISLTKINWTIIFWVIVGLAFITWTKIYMYQNGLIDKIFSF